MIIIYTIFKAEVKKQLAIKGWSYKELAKATGYKLSTIQGFMSKFDRGSDDMIKCIAKVLDIDY